MGLLTFTLTGTGFILIGSLESLRSSQTNKLNKNPSPFYITLSIFSSFIILSSLTSLFNAVTSNDAVGSSLQLQIIPIALLFLFHSLLSLSLSLPSHLLNLILTFAFSQEFLLFYLQRKDPSGVENRYYDLLLVPIAVCVFSTLIELLGSDSLSSSSVAKLGRGVGLILQGTWFIQMGLSLFYSSFVAQGCDLHLVSKGNYSLRCKGHSEYHRGRAIATLQFNCHLALMVVLFVGFYSFTFAKIGNSVNNTLRYTPIEGEMQSFDNSVGKFSLDSDDDNDEIKDANVGNQKLSNGINGNHSNH